MDVAIREDPGTITVVISTLTDKELTAMRTTEDAVWSVAVMTVDLVRDSRQGDRDDRHQEGSRRTAASNMVTMAARRRLPWTERDEDDNPRAVIEPFPGEDNAKEGRDHEQRPRPRCDRR